MLLFGKMWLVVTAGSFWRCLDGEPGRVLNKNWIVSARGVRQKSASSKLFVGLLLSVVTHKIQKIGMHIG